MISPRIHLVWFPRKRAKGISKVLCLVKESSLSFSGCQTHRNSHRLAAFFSVTCSACTWFKMQSSGRLKAIFLAVRLRLPSLLFENTFSAVSLKSIKLPGDKAVGRQRQRRGEEKEAEPSRLGKKLWEKDNRRSLKKHFNKPQARKKATCGHVPCFLTSHLLSLRK